MSQQFLGRAIIHAGDERLETMPGASLDIGGVTRKVIKTSRRIGFAEEVKEAMLECEIVMQPGTSLDRFRGMTAETIVFACDTGQRYALSRAFLTEPPTLKDGDGGNVTLKFASGPAEEVL